MEQRIEKFLAKFKAISPRADFALHSKFEIFKQPQKSGFKFGFWENAKLTVSLVMATLLLVVGLGASSYFQGGSSPLLGSFNNKNLLVEANSLNFQIQIREADYFTESAKTVAVALDEISSEDESENNE